MSDAPPVPLIDTSDTKGFQPADYLAADTSLVDDSLTTGSLLEQRDQLTRLAERKAEGRAVLLQLQTLDRQAFRPELLKMLLGAPSLEAIQAYAERAPDRYYQALAIVARLGGYTEKPEDGLGNASLFTSINRLSDAELLERLASIDGKLGQLVSGRIASPATIDGEFTEPLADLL